MSEFNKGRSNSSKEMRDSLMASEGHVPDVESTVPLSKYIQYTYRLFKVALQTSSEGYISRTYVAWKRFLTFIARKLPEHPKFRVSDTSTESFKKWIKEASDYAFEELESIVTQMDREEDAARQEVGFVTTEEVVIDEDFLLDEFDGDGTESTPITTGGKEEDQSSQNTVPSTAALFNPTKLKILEQQCNSQLEQNKGTPIVTSEALLCENPNVPTVESVPVSVTASNTLGIKPNDKKILMTLLGDRGIKLHGAPPPQRLLLQLRFTTPQGIKQISFHRLDFFISFLRFFNPPRGWGKEESMLKSSREAIETNRCFFIHLGIAINVHPFTLQAYFRHVAATIMTESEDDFQKELLQSTLNYSGFVDANCLIYIWPREMMNCRICLLSGNLKQPIFCCFYPSHVKDLDTLSDIIIHSDGSHFTLLKPAAAANSASFSVLTKLLEAARAGGCIVQEIPVDVQQSSQSYPLSVFDFFQETI